MDINLKHLACRYVKRAKEEQNELVQKIYFEVSDALAMAYECARRHDSVGADQWIDQAVERCAKNKLRVPVSLLARNSVVA